MSNCENCGKKLNVFTEATGLPLLEDVKICTACKTKLDDIFYNFRKDELTSDNIWQYKDELLSKGASENGIKLIQKSLEIKNRQSEKLDRKIGHNKMVMELMSSMPVTTGDLHQEYEIIGPVYFQVSNKGLFSSALSELTEQYRSEIENMKASGTMSGNRADWGFLYGEWSVGQNQFESAFYIATQELKKRAALVGGDAIIGMRQDIDLDSNGFSYFYLQMYGTAVKIKEKRD